MNATVSVLPFVDGQTAVQLRAGTMPNAARDLGGPFARLADEMHYSRCGSLAKLDDLVGQLSTMLHGFEIALERHSSESFAVRCDRAVVANLRNDIANYMQARANELR